MVRGGVEVGSIAASAELHRRFISFPTISVRGAIKRERGLMVGGVWDLRHSPTTAITCLLGWLFNYEAPITAINLSNGCKTKLSNTVYEQIMPLR